MDRRGFLGTLGLAGGLVVAGPEVLEAFARLTHRRKSFPSAWGNGAARPFTREEAVRAQVEINRIWRAAQEELVVALAGPVVPDHVWLQRVDPFNVSGWREALGA